jgi:Uma2 family endonuclease
MSVALLESSPLLPLEGLGRYRRADYEALPEEPRCELIYGRFHVSPSPTLLHQFLVIALSHELHEIAMANGGLALAAPMDVHLADHSVVQPDILYICAENQGIVDRWIEGSPDLVVEVLSPGNVRRDRNDKLALYAEAGVREYWIVDAVERQIEFLTLREGAWEHQTPRGSHYQSPQISEIRIDLETFWRSVEQRFPGEPSSP